MIVPAAMRRITFATFAAAATFALVVLRAVETVDPYWDTLAYHWIFAARIAGLCDRSCFSMPPGMEALYDGFPLAVHALQGLIWRATGTPAMGDLVNVAAVVALCAYLRGRFAVPLAWSWLALLAIPVVQVELTSSYVDLAVNAAATIGVLVAVRLWLQPEDDHRADVALALAALGFAVGGKFLMLPIALLAWGSIVLLCAWRPATIGLRRRAAPLLLLTVLGALVLLPKLALNAEAFRNPFYPVAVDIGIVHLPGTTTADQASAVSAFWAPFPQPVRWLASVSEFDAFQGRPLPWTVSQGDVPQTSPSFRMGGYFVAYVLGCLALLAWTVRSSRRARALAWAMAALTLLCALLPNSHDLRYYLFWMATLVSFVLIASYAPAFAETGQGPRRRATQLVVGIALTTVAMMTGTYYLAPQGTTLEKLLDGTDRMVATFPAGGTVCVRDRNRFAILYASVFHPGKPYHMRLLAGDEPAFGCTVRVTLPG